MWCQKHISLSLSLSLYIYIYIYIYITLHNRYGFAISIGNTKIHVATLTCLEWHTENFHHRLVLNICEAIPWYLCMFLSFSYEWRSSVVQARMCKLGRDPLIFLKILVVIGHVCIYWSKVAKGFSVFNAVLLPWPWLWPFLDHFCNPPYVRNGSAKFHRTKHKFIDNIWDINNIVQDLFNLRIYSSYLLRMDHRIATKWKSIHCLSACSVAHITSCRRQWHWSQIVISMSWI